MNKTPFLWREFSQGEVFFMFNRERKNRIKNRLTGLVAIMLLILLILNFRLYYVQNKYSTRDTSGLKGNHKQYEDVSENNYLLLDRNGENLFEYEIKYNVVFDSMAFRLNNLNKNMGNMTSLLYIMGLEDENFTFDSIIKSGGLPRYEVSKNSFEKLQLLTGIKGMYLYKNQVKSDDYVGKIENIISNPQKTIDKKNSKGEIKTEYVDKGEGSLEILVRDELKENKNPKAIFERDHEGIYGEEKYVDYEENLNVRLTLDKRLQSIVREVLNRDEYESFKNAGVVLIDSLSGDILSLAQKHEDQKNIVLGHGDIGYEPGSIFKILTLEVAMEKNNVSLSDEFICTSKICKSDKTHGKLSVRKAFELSCNDIFYEIISGISEKELIDFARNQGLFSKVLDIDNYNEVTGSVNIKGNNFEGNSSGKNNHDNYAKLINLAIGQSIQTNLIQMAGIISAVVNQGQYVKPSILKGFENQEGVMIKTLKGVKKDVISKETAEDLKSVMLSTVEEGTAMITQIDGVEIGAKTGTAEAAGNELHGWLLGYFKYENRYYTLGVMVPEIKYLDRGDSRPAGGNTAGYIFRDIILEIIEN